jgi:hypothetical protein
MDDRVLIGVPSLLSDDQAGDLTLDLLDRRADDTLIEVLCSYCFNRAGKILFPRRSLAGNDQVPKGGA